MIKQTQTKMFDFSDVGLDFCAGSKNKFPEVFKKMLVTGYNPKTVNGVSISGAQITLTYGVSHGYVASRVLKVTASGGFVKEVYIDSVTTNTVVCTVLDGVTTGLSGTIDTIIAPLGWTIEYEVGNVHIYKFKHLDNTDMYLRLCFQDQAARRNCVSPCIGKTANLTTGVITDSDALQDTVALTTPNDTFKWEFQSSAVSTFNSSSYSAGLATFGKGMVVGSPYHLAVLSNRGNATHFSTINGFAPVSVLDYSNLNYPILIGAIDPAAITGSGTNTGQDFSHAGGNGGAAYLGKIRVNFQMSNTTSLANQISKDLFFKPNSATSYLPSEIDSFNTTTASLISIYERVSSQFLGFICSGMFECHYANATKPSQAVSDSPSIVTEIDFSNNSALHHMSGGNVANSVFIAFPIEEIKSGA